jgi:hypothetical protein
LTSNVTNIIAFSHRLHIEAESRLAKLYPGAVFHEMLYHCEDRNALETDIDRIMGELKAKGALDGRVVITPPSLSAAASLLIIAIFRETGHFPDIVNLMQTGAVYVPGYKTPVFRGQAFGDRRRRARAS